MLYDETRFRLRKAIQFRTAETMSARFQTLVLTFGGTRRTFHTEETMPIKKAFRTSRKTHDYPLISRNR